MVWHEVRSIHHVWVFKAEVQNFLCVTLFDEFHDFIVVSLVRVVFGAELLQFGGQTSIRNLFVVWEVNNRLPFRNRDRVALTIVAEAVVELLQCRRIVG